MISCIQLSKPRLLFLVIVSFLILQQTICSAIESRQETIENTSVTAQPKIAQPYLIGPGDEIEITVMSYPELSIKTVVLPDGCISFPLLGNLKAEGLSTDAFAKFIQNELNRHIYNPQVAITLLQMRSKRFSVLGEVKKPGIFPLWDKKVTIYEAIAQAEGFLPTAYSQEVRVMRTDSSGKETTLKLDLSEMSVSQTKVVNFNLESGDVVYVPGMRSKRYSILGEVKKTGTFPMGNTNITIYEAIADAEGFLPTAFPEQIRVMRVDSSGNKSTVNLDLSETAADKTKSLSFTLQPDDVVFIPGESNTKQICVLGKVAVPGRFHFSPGMTVIDALTSAGWVTKEGVASSVMLARRNAGNREFMRINAQGVVSKNDMTQDISLQPGDIIYVPEKFISKISTFAGFFSSSVEPVAHSYLRVYDAVNPANVVIER